MLYSFSNFDEINKRLITKYEVTLYANLSLIYQVHSLLETFD